MCLLEVSFFLRLILHGGSGLDPSNAIQQNGRPPEDTLVVENPPPPVNPPIQPIEPVNSFPLPSKLEGANNPNQEDMWPKWLRHFERYRIASGLQKKSNQEHVGIFLFTMRYCVNDIVKTLSINERNRFLWRSQTTHNGYFAACRSVIVERARFNRRRQNPGESVDTFIQDLYRLTENCEYGTLKDELVGDRIIVGVLDDTLSDHLKAKPDLVLADAVRMRKEAEARKQNRTVVRGVETQNEVDYVSQPHSHNQQNATNVTETKDWRKSPPRMAVPAFGVDARTMTGSIAQLESLFVVTATKRAISSLSVSARDLIRERYMQWNKKMRRTYTSSMRSAVIRTIGLHR